MPDAETAKRSALRLLAWVTRRIGWRYGAHLALTLGLAGVTLLPPRLFQFFAASLSGPSPAAGPVAGKLLAFGLAIAVALSALNYLSSLSRERVQLRIEALLRLSATRKLLTTPLETFDGLPRGEFLTRLGADLAKVESFVALAIPGHVRSVAILLLAGWLFLSQCGALALVPLALVLAVAVLNFFAQSRLLPLLDELRSLHGGIFQDMLQSFEGVRTIRTHGAADAHLSGIDSRIQRMAGKSVRVVSLAGLFDGANTLSYQAMIAGCLAFAAWRVALGRMDFNTALTFPFYLGFFYSSAESLASAITEWHRFFVDSYRLARFLPLADESAPLPPPAPGEAVPERLGAKGLEVGYLGRALIGPLDFSLSPGRTTVVLGPSGCGKSTLLDVFAGLRSPLGGSVRAGERTGADASRLCAIVEQRACLWAGSVRDNLSLGSRAGDEAMWSALEAVGLHGLVAAQGGLAAPVADRGLNFSEGQRYRLALARALLLPQPFLLLDEPFAALDAESIATIVAAINREKTKRGFLIVTHQLPRGLQVDEVMDLGGRAGGSRPAGSSLSKSRLCVTGTRPASRPTALRP